MNSDTAGPRSMRNRLSEIWAGSFSRGIPLFTSTKRRLPSVIVRGDQMAEELGGRCVRSRCIRGAAARSAPAVIWVCEADAELVGRFETWTPQLLDVINPQPDDSRAWAVRSRFRYLIVSTAKTGSYLGRTPERPWKTWPIHHHHCNSAGFRLPEERLERPKTVGYVGEPENLHDSEAIRAAVEKMGLQWLPARSHELSAYRNMDIGIAWTRRDELRDATRSNVKMVNFAAHGIPSVVCDYESYRDCDAQLGGGACLIRALLDEFLDAIAELAQSEKLRREVAAKAAPAQTVFSRQEIAKQYRRMIDEVRADFSA